MNTSDARMILLALKEFCVETYQNVGGGFITDEAFQNCYNQLKVATGALHTAFPQRFKDFRLDDYSSHKLRNKYRGTVFVQLKADINFYLTATKDQVEQTSNKERSTQGVTVTKQGLFFAQDYFEVYFSIKDIIQSAQHHVVIIDGHVSEKLFSLLELFKGKVPVTIVTKTPQMRPEVKNLVKKFNERHNKSLKVIADNSYYDRYVFIDGKELYHLGSVGNSERNGFMFSQITEPLLIKSLSGDLSAKGYL